MLSTTILAIFVIAQAGSPDFPLPAEIVKLMDASDVAYSLKTVDRVDPLDLVAPGERVSPSIYAVTDGKSERVAQVPGSIRETLAEAERAFGAKDFAAAASAYKRATEREPTFFKTYTYLGDALFRQEKLTEAVQALSKAIELNPIDYQAYFFLSTVYAHSKDSVRQLDAVTTAYALDQNNPRLRPALLRALSANGLALRDDRWKFPVQVVVKDPKHVEISLSKAAPDWAALATCVAAWRVEPLLRQRASAAGMSVQQAMPWNCLRNQAAFALSRIESGQSVDADMQRLAAVAKAKLLNAMIIWEYIGPTQPQAIGTLPSSSRQDLSRYIKEYVYYRPSI